MKNIVIKLLAFFTKAVIRKYQPKIVGITGSVGKTGVKEFASLVLSEKFKLRASIKNYNNELGLPLSVIGLESPGRKIGGWLLVFLKFFKLLLRRDKNYPEVLVLEMGVDRPGDMDYFLSIAQPDIAIITNISHSHLEYFSSLEKIKKEKLKLVENLKSEGIAILNFDNEDLRKFKDRAKSQVISYGLKGEPDFLAQDISLSFPSKDFSSDFYGLNFKLKYQEKVIPINLPGIIARPYIYSSLAVLALASCLGFNLIEISERLKKASVLPGRMRPLLGIKNTIIIDDTYNSSPESTLSALEAIKSIKLENGRKILVLGDMLELGNYTEEGHRLVGSEISNSNIDLLFLIGDKVKYIGNEAVKKGFNEDNIFYFSDLDEAKDSIKNNISQEDLILVKASQGIRLEKIVKNIMLESEKADELLVRQGLEWN